METKSLVESKNIGKIALIIILIAIAFAIFQAGVFVGFRKASFLFNYGDNYYRNFGGIGRKDGNIRGGRMMNWNSNGGYGYNNVGMMGYFQDELSSGHGVVGKIIRTDKDRIIVLGNDNMEKVINVSSTTKVFERRDEIKLSELKVDQNIVIIGNPDSVGQINAKLIRIMPFTFNK